ncbi:MAG: urocanate hydratase [candidate division KSB1 bacterium]|nr:urocanate hydratase [candidate division KSB1 bacterium]MDZ7335022.1 urocanate hydratase [candidate division KSB1 bacterium]MDZ7357791.1 urocanate hydratase [candidate division KSB1 bacterium]MDZ7399391.1 urocanate hydratase [candidate division KSB1 bacterium]
MDNNQIAKAMSIKLEGELPAKKEFLPGIRRAPNRGLNLTRNEIVLALKNALRYIPEEWHEVLAPEFLEELKTMGRIYGYRFRPEGRIWGKPIDEYRGIPEARGLQVMIDNNLDFETALYPYELVTYGETGQVFQNWMQYCLVKKYLEVMREDQTLVVSSGHPVGLFPSHRNAPRVISTNGLIVGAWDNPDEFKRLAALGVSNYGQMTAGGWMYIGPQGIVHGTYITVLNAGRKYLGIPADKDLKGVCFVTSGLGGMSGAQAKAIEIAGGVGVIAEVDYSRIKTRLDQGWLSRVSDDLSEVIRLMQQFKASGKAISIGYYGNIVDLLEYLDRHQIQVELLSDQTSCHAVYEGGYTPVGVTFEQGRQLLKDDPAKFRRLVDESLKRHFRAIKKLTEKGAFFWDYGNSFMASVFEAGEKSIAKNGKDTSEGFIFPSYVEDIMGPICFDRGFGPFRWVCLSGKEEDLRKTDQAAMSCIDPNKSSAHRDNYYWIKNAEQNKLVVGTKARILYADEEGRVNIALKFNELIRNGEIGPVMIGRDHHDVSGTDSPYRETANIYDGSRTTADMSVQCFGGNIARGMTLVVLSNGGGVGIGRASNGGNGIFLDGSERVDQIIKTGLSWDVMGGVARRSWARNEPALETALNWNLNHRDSGHITLPFIPKEGLVESLIEKHLG